jgi:hypothetical protein
MQFPGAQGLGEILPERSVTSTPDTTPVLPSDAQQNALLNPGTQVVGVEENVVILPGAGILEEPSQDEAVLSYRSAEQTGSLGKIVLTGESEEGTGEQRPVHVQTGVDAPAPSAGDSDLDASGDTPPGDGGGGDIPGNAELSSEEPEEPPETYDAVVVRMSSLQQEQSEIQAVLRETFPDHPHAVDEAMQAATAQLPTDEYHTVDELHAAYQAAMRAQLGDEAFSGAEDAIERFFEAVLEEEALDMKRAPLAQQEFTALHKELAQTVDWDRVIAHETEIDTMSDTAGIWGFMGGAGQSPRAPENYLLSARSWQIKLAEGGLMRDESTSPPDNSVLEHQAEWLPDGDDHVVEALARWERLSEDTLKYLSPERREVMRAELAGFKSASYHITTIGVELGLCAWEDAQPPTEMVDAFRRHVAGMFEAYDQADHNARALWSNMGTPLHTANASLLAAERGIANPNAWVAKKVAEFPSWYTAGLRTVIFTKKAETIVIVNNEEADYKNVGGHYPGARAVEVDVDPLYKQERRQLSNAEAQEQAWVRFGENLDYVLTQYAHNHCIPTRWLREWQSTAEEERVQVTEYLGIRQGQNVEIGTRRDLAASITLYKHDPAALLALGGRRRFWQINQLLNMYDDDGTPHATASTRPGR